MPSQRSQAGTGRFTIGPDQHLNLLGEAMVGEPLTGASIVSAAACFLLQMQPYLELANEQRRAAVQAETAPTLQMPASPACFTAERRRA